MSDPYAEIRQLAKDETRLISAESYSTLRRFVLAALPVVEAAREAMTEDHVERVQERLRGPLTHLEEMTRGQ